MTVWKFFRLGSSEKIGPEQPLSEQYANLAARFVQREEEMVRQLGEFGGYLE